MKKSYEPSILWPGLSIGLFLFVHPLFIFAVFMVIYKYRTPWITQINQQFSHYKWWYFAFPITAFILGYINTLPFAINDLMRHVVAYQFNYDYRSIYVYSPLLPSFNFWIGFEIFCGKLHQLLGPEYSVRVVQALGVISFYAAFFFALYKILKDREDKWLWCTIIFVLCVPSFSRVFIGRLDIFLTAWMLSAVFLRPLIWLLIGIALVPSYALSILYAPAVLLLNTSWRNKIIYGAIYGLACSIFWYIYSDGEWLKIPEFISQWNANRVGAAASETNFGLSLNIHLLGLVILLYYFLYKASFRLAAHAIPLCLVIAYFALPNYDRYMFPVFALTGLLCALYAPKNIKINPQWSLLIFMYASIASYNSIPNFSYEKLPKFKIPENAVVLTKANESTVYGTYSSILFNPRVKYGRSWELGTMDKAVQTLVLTDESIDCHELKKFAFTHVQEISLKTVPSCLSLVQLDHGWRLWEIK